MGDHSDRRAFFRVGGKQLHISSDEGRAFVEDCTRWTEQLMEDADLKAKFGMDDVEWQTIKRNPDIVRMVRRRRVVREATGVLDKERKKFEAARTAAIARAAEERRDMLTAAERFIDEAWKAFDATLDKLAPSYPGSNQGER